MKLKLLILLILVLSFDTNGNARSMDFTALFFNDIAAKKSSENGQKLQIDYAPTIFTLGIKSENYNDTILEMGTADLSMDEIQRVRLQFTCGNGFIRPLLLAFTPNNEATDGFDYGYDALNPDQYPNDMFWNIDGGNYVIQGVGAFDVSKVYPFNVYIANAGAINIALTGLENFSSEIDVFIYDFKLNTYTQINSNAYTTELNEGIHKNRFFLAFRSINPLSISESDKNTYKVNYLSHSSEIFIKSTGVLEVEKVHLLNLMGQTIFTFDKQDFENFGRDIKISADHIPLGTYIIKVETSNFVINRKILIS